MKTKFGTIFDSSASVICIPTNSTVKTSGELIMGAGLAKECLNHYPGLDKTAGDMLRKGQIFSKMHVLPEYNLLEVEFLHRTLLLCQTKDYVWKKTPLSLVKRTINKLSVYMEVHGSKTFAIPYLGCGHGKLNKAEFLLMLVEAPGSILSDRVELWSGE